MKREHMPFKYMGNFKAFAADYEFYLSLSDKPVSVCLTERQMYILSVWNSYTPWMTRWYNTDDVSAPELAIIAAEIEDLLMCGCGVPVPSITDILNAQTYNNSTTADYITTYNTWNTAGQTVASIAPSLDYSTGDPADIDKLLCLGLELYLTVIVEQAKGIKQGELEDAKDLTKQLANVFGALGVAGGAGIAAGGAAAGIVGFFGGPWLILGLALAAVGLTIANAVYPMDLAVFTDPVAFEDVYCTMVNNMVGATPTRSAFQNALTPNEFAPGSHAAQLASVVQPYLDNLDSYLQFLVAMNDLYGVSDFGVLPECGCVEPTDCWDFAAGEQGFAPWVNGFGVEFAAWDNGWKTGANASIILFQKDVSPDVYASVTVTFLEPFEDSGDPPGAIFLKLLNYAQTVEYGSSNIQGETEYLFTGSFSDGLTIYAQTTNVMSPTQRIILTCKVLE